MFWRRDTEYRIHSLAINGDGSRIAIGLGEHGVQLMDGSGELLWHHRAEENAPADEVAITSDGSRIAIGSRTGHVSLLSDTSELIWQAKTNASVYSITTTPIGSRIVSGFSGS